MRPFNLPAHDAISRDRGNYYVATGWLPCLEYKSSDHKCIFILVGARHPKVA